jgi:hypothetical protein
MQSIFKIEETVVDAHLDFRLIELLFALKLPPQPSGKSCVKRFSLRLLQGAPNRKRFERLKKSAYERPRPFPAMNG